MMEWIRDREIMGAYISIDYLPEFISKLKYFYFFAYIRGYSERIDSGRRNKNLQNL